MEPAVLEIPHPHLHHKGAMVGQEKLTFRGLAGVSAAVGAALLRSVFLGEQVAKVEMVEQELRLLYLAHP
jgi:hypothetical protein